MVDTVGHVRFVLQLNSKPRKEHLTGWTVARYFIRLSFLYLSGEWFNIFLVVLCVGP